MSGELLGDLDLARVRGDHHGVLRVLETLVHEIVDERVHRRQVIHGESEVALDLARVQIHRHHPLGPCGLDHVRYKPRRYGLTRLGLPVLTRVGVPRDDGHYPLGRGPLGGVYHDQELHQVSVDRLAQGLDDEHVGPTDALQVTGVELPTGKLDQLDPGQIHVEPVGYALGQRGVTLAADYHQTLLRGLRQVAVVHYQSASPPSRSLADRFAS